MPREECKTGSGQAPAVVCSCDLGVRTVETFLQLLHGVSTGVSTSATHSIQTVTE